MPAPIPVVLLTGFLGAGKTSLLNHLLHQRDARVGVVVNDFGSVGVDAMLVAGQVDAMVSLANGCLCCATDPAELDTLFQRLTVPRLGIDVIVVEASGLAEPRAMARMVLGSNSSRIRYGGLVQVVDALEFDAGRSRHPVLERHLRLADLVVLNKADLVSPERLAALRGELARIVRTVPIQPTTYGRVDPRLLFDPPTGQRRRAVTQLSFDDLLLPEMPAAHLHDGYRSVTVATGPVEPRAFVEFLEHPPAGLFRVKGRVEFAVAGEPRAFVVQLVGSQLRFVPDNGRLPGRTTLVFIGVDLSEGDVRAGLARAEPRGAAPLDAQALLPVWRHVELRATAPPTPKARR
ncbi:CobW family GTP-binding protein [Skermania piniformis]|uniref:GTP-binding protein n=1 Tax=Skermania pinensis TaxID=39122 RepID=A0ABX8S4R9_9ACTN|nr:GTP-binding protein [Skermania piniformis]QXQ12809.1 GTP-binding protein [Skermania piniformis]